MRRQHRPTACGHGARVHLSRWIRRCARRDPARARSAGWRSSRSMSAPITKVEWTCPMHPEIVRDAPGACPICGMALEPRTVTLEETNPELDDMTRRFWWSVGSTAPILAFMVSEFLPGQPLQRLLPHGWMNWILLALATPGRAVGRLAVLRARLGVGRQPPPQHVHADRARRRRGVCATASSRRSRRACSRTRSG